MPPSKWASEFRAGLGFEYVAISDIGVGDEITVDTPRGERNYEVLSFTTIHDSDAS